MKRTLPLVAAVVLIFTASASAHLPKKIHRGEARTTAHRHAEKNLNHALYVCVHGRGRPKREHCRALPWLKRLVRDSAPVVISTDWIAKQIHAAENIGRSASADPWPNCPDPIFGGASSWEQTVMCENRKYYELFGFPRAWMDSPGYYRCGLQFDPSWERRFGRLCP